MGRKKKGKKQQPKRWDGASKTKRLVENDHANEILNLVESVSENDILNFSCEIPSNEEMDELHFPSPSIKHPSIEWLSNNLLIGVGEWGSALYDLLLEDEHKGLVDFEDDECDNYSKFSNEKQSEYRIRLIEVVRRKRRVTKYKKWLYAKERLKNEANVVPGDKKVSWSDCDNWSDYESVDVRGARDSSSVNEER